MQRPKVSGVVEHIYIYVIRRLKVKLQNVQVPYVSCSNSNTVHLHAKTKLGWWMMGAGKKKYM
jgi:hypothetical protein